MCLFKKERLNPVLVGLIQAALVVLYCALISCFFLFLSNVGFYPGAFWGPLVMLVLLVFSAAVMGIVVFGYAVILAFDDQLKRAGRVLLWTLIFIIVFAACLIGIALLV